MTPRTKNFRFPACIAQQQLLWWRGPESHEPATRYRSDDYFYSRNNSGSSGRSTGQYNINNFIIL